MLNNSHSEIQELSNFEVLRELKVANAQHQAIKKRITVLKIHDERNIKKISTQQNKINKILQVRDSIQKEKAKDELVRKSRVVEIQRKRSDNKRSKEYQKEKLNEIRSIYVEKKVEKHKDLCLVKLRNEEKINREKKQYLNKNKSLRNKVIEMEKQSQEHILDYLNRKTMTIHSNIVAERRGYFDDKIRKEKQLNKASLLQIQMIKKHSESQVAYKQAKNKLDTMLGNIKRENRKNKFNLQSSEVNRSPETAQNSDVL